MKINIVKENKVLEIEFNGKVKEILMKLEINPETVIVVKDDELVTEEDFLEDSDEIKIMSVVSGG